MSVDDDGQAVARSAGTPNALAVGGVDAGENAAVVTEDIAVVADCIEVVPLMCRVRQVCSAV